MRFGLPWLLACVAAVGCSVQTSGLSLNDTDAGARTLDAERPRDTGPGGVDAGDDPPDATSTDVLIPPPPPPADSGPPPPPDSGPPPPPPADAGPPAGSVGEPCTWSTDCQPGLMCFTSGFIPGGYCTRACTTDFECGAWGRCGDFWGYRYCARRCASSGDCRAGYECSSGYCLPSS